MGELDICQSTRFLFCQLSSLDFKGLERDLIGIFYPPFILMYKYKENAPFSPIL